MTMLESVPVSSMYAATPAAITPVIVTEAQARAILDGFAANDAHYAGVWDVSLALWSRYDHAWDGVGEPGTARLVGQIQVAYGSPSKYEVTLFRALVTPDAAAVGWTGQHLFDEALAAGGVDASAVKRSAPIAPPRPFRF